MDKKEINLINNIKKYSGENIFPPLPCFEYNINDISKNVIKYICSQIYKLSYFTINLL